MKTTLYLVIVFIATLFFISKPKQAIKYKAYDPIKTYGEIFTQAELNKLIRERETLKIKVKRNLEYLENVNK